VTRRDPARARVAALSNSTRPPQAPHAGTGPPPWYRIGPVLALAEDDAEEGEGTSSATADVYVYDTIGGWFGIDADDFVRDVASLNVDQIVLHLNTPGGDATEGVAIANVLRAHRARVVVRVDGLAASAGSVIAMAGDEVVMGLGSQLMIHDPWIYTLGNVEEIERDLQALNSTGDSLAATYAAKAGGTVEEWRAVMKAETWYTAEEAVTAGLADRVAAADETGTAEGDQITPGRSSSLDDWFFWDSLRAQDRFDLSAFTYAGRDRAPAPAMPGRQTPAASAAGPTQRGRSRAVALTEEQLDTMRQTLGLPDDADEAAIVEAIGQSDDTDDTETEDTSTETETETEALANAEAAAGVVSIDAGTLAALRADAELGRQAHARQQREDRESLVSAAVADGRIAPARKAAWIKKLEKDPGEAETLASLEKGLVPVGAPIGHAGGGADEPDPVTATRASAAYKNWSM